MQVDLDVKVVRALDDLSLEQVLVALQDVRLQAGLGPLPDGFMQDLEGRVPIGGPNLPEPEEREPAKSDVIDEAIRTIGPVDSFDSFGEWKSAVDAEIRRRLSPPEGADASPATTS